MSTETIPAPAEVEHEYPAAADIRQLVKEFDPKLDLRTSLYRLGTLLLASAFLGPDVDKILVHLGYQGTRWERTLRQAAKRLHQNKIWLDGKVNAEWNFAIEMTDDECSRYVVSFWLDVMVAKGELIRVYEGGIKYERGGKPRPYCPTHYVLLEDVMPDYKRYCLPHLKAAGIVSAEQLIYAVNQGDQNDMIDIARNLANQFPNLPIPE